MTKEENAMEYAKALYPNTETYNRIAYEGYIAGTIDKDAQTIAGIELALKKAATDYIYTPHALKKIDPAAILSELKNDIKEG